VRQLLKRRQGTVGKRLKNNSIKKLVNTEQNIVTYYYKIPDYIVDSDAMKML